MIDLYQLWINAKETERLAVEARRKIEDELAAVFQIPEDMEGTDNREVGAYKIKIVGRMNRKVNADLLQEVAAENGLSDYLSTLFRWKPEIAAAAWKSADEKITSVLSAAITTEPGRPSFSITINTEEKENG